MSSALWTSTSAPLTWQPDEVEHMSNEEARRRFAPPIYIMDGAGKITGGGWGGGGRDADEDFSVREVSVTQGDKQQVRVTTAREEFDDSLILWRLLVPPGASHLSALHH